MFKNFFTIIAIALFALSSTAWAKNIDFVLPSGPGSLNDTLARSIVDSFNKISPNFKLIPINRPGGDMLIAVDHFKSSRPAIMFGNVSMHVMNYHFRPDPLPYSDADFNHVMLVGESVMVFFAGADSGIKTPQDLVTKLPTHAKPFIGIDNSLNLANVLSVTRRHNLTEVREIRYRTSNEVAASVAGGFHPVGHGSPSFTVIGLIKEGKLVAIGNSSDEDVVVDGIKFPSINKAIDAPGFSAMNVISLNGQFTKEEADEVSKLLFQAVKDTEVQATMKRLGMTYRGWDGARASSYIKQYRDDVGALINKQ